MDQLSRNEVGQAAPRDGLDMTDFPVEVAAGTTIYRAKHCDLGAWWFASIPKEPHEEGGRFDLTEPRGTCYWADSPEAAVRERLSHRTLRENTVTAARARAMLVAIARTPEGVALADITADRAVRFGVSAELSTMEHYDIPQLWAAAFDQAGLGGVRYSTRFTSTGSAHAWAIFGAAGAPDPAPFEGSSIAGEFACRSAGIRVISTGETALPHQFTMLPVPPDETGPGQA